VVLQFSGRGYNFVCGPEGVSHDLLNL
jgi:hypothetical protein